LKPQFYNKESPEKHFRGGSSDMESSTDLDIKRHVELLKANQARLSRRQAIFFAKQVGQRDM
jgi:hypothetical protein